MTIFVILLLSTLVTAMLQLSTEQIQLMQNQVYAAGALATAEAGLNDAFSQLRSDSNWQSGFSNKTFNSGSYTVTITGSQPTLTVESTGTSWNNYVSRVAADVTISAASPYVIRINGDSLFQQIRCIFKVADIFHCIGGVYQHLYRSGIVL